MKKIRNSEQLLLKKKLLELEQLQLEKQIRHTWNGMEKTLSKPVTVLSLATPLLQQLPALVARKAGKGLLKRLAGWFVR
jgi:hypothetical protein